MAVLRHGIDIDFLDPLRGLDLIGGIHGEHRQRIINQAVAADPGRIRRGAFAFRLAQRPDQRRPRQGQMRQGILIGDVACHTDGVTRRIGNLRVAVHIDGHREAVEEERIGPSLLRRGQSVHVAFKEEEVARAVVPAGTGGEHIILLPGIERLREGRQRGVRVVDQPGRLDEDRVGEHIDLVDEGKDLDAGIVGAVDTFDDLAFVVAHRTALLKDGDGILRVEIQEAGTQQVAFLVGKLDEGAAEFGAVLVDDVVEFVAGQHRLILKDLDVAESVDQVAVEVPVGRVAEQEGPIVQETRRSKNLAVMLSVLLRQLRRTGAQQHYQAVAVFAVLLCEGREGGEQERCREEKQTETTRHRAYFRNLSAQPSRWKSQSLKSGSMTI